MERCFTTQVEILDRDNNKDKRTLKKRNKKIISKHKQEHTACEILLLFFSFRFPSEEKNEEKNNKKKNERKKMSLFYLMRSAFFPFSFLMRVRFVFFPPIELA